MKQGMQVREANTGPDLPAITRLINPYEGSPLTEGEVQRWMERSVPGRFARHVVCTDEQDRVIGYGNAIHAETSPEGHFYAWLVVDPAFQKRGIGSAIWEGLLETLREQGAKRATGEVKETEPDSYEFAARRGFSLDRRRFHSSLDLLAFDETPYLPGIAALEAGGIRFCTLADFPDTPETRQKYCDLNFAAVRDIPGEDWDAESYPSFFYEYIHGARWFRRESQILALDGDRWVGFAIVRFFEATGDAYNATTGVIREYRGRKIALALKVLAARHARQKGAKKIDTDNDSLNAPMLAVNRKMGYVPEPGSCAMVRFFDHEEQK